MTIAGLVTLVGLITIGLSTYLILYSQPLYSFLAPWLKLFERKIPQREKEEIPPEGSTAGNVILFGLGRYGNNIAQNLRQLGMNVIGVDFDSKAVSAWRKQGLTAYYGDAEAPEFPATLPLNQAHWVVSTIPQLDINLALLDSLHHYGFSGRKALTAHTSRDAEILKESGADLILVPFADAAKEAAEMLAGGNGLAKGPSS